MLRIVLVLSAIVTTSFAGPIMYAVVVIPAPSGLNIDAVSGINDSGQVAGSADNGITTQAFIGSPSGSTAIPLPYGSAFASGAAVNDSGEVAGSSAQPLRGFIGTTAGSAQVPLPSGGWLYAGVSALNDSGQVTGTVSMDLYGLDSQAFIGTTAGSAVIPLLPGWSQSGGYGVNASGQVVGTLSGGANSQAFIGNLSGSALIPLPLGWTSSVGYAVNDSGHVAGQVFNGTASQAFIGTTIGSALIPLPLGATTASVTLGALNDLGVVVGDSDVGPWMWDAADGTVLLNSLFPPVGPNMVSGWDLTQALSISNTGLILAEGSCFGGPAEYVELLPTTGAGTCVASVPEPSNSAFCGVGLLVLLFARLMVLRARQT
jgi:hypothetical protein